MCDCRGKHHTANKKIAIEEKFNLISLKEFAELRMYNIVQREQKLDTRENEIKVNELECYKGG